MKNFKNLFLLFLLLLSVSKVSANEFLIIKDIQIHGNKKTKDYIILRELGFKKNDTLKKANLENVFNESENNLINTQLFHFAQIEIEDSTALPFIIVQITITERWYLWPVPVADIEERNFNSWWQEKNFSRLSAGLNLSYLNVGGRMEKIRFSFLTGYNKLLGLEYEFPYINNKKTIGLKILTSFTRNHETRLLTDSNKINFLRIENENALEESNFGLGLSFRPNLYFSNEFYISFLSYVIHDSILKLNPNFSVNNAEKLSFFHIYNKIKLDKRDFKPYALHGYYMDIELFKYGVGLVKNAPNVFSIKTTMRKYFQLSNRFYYAVGGVVKLSNSNYQPYIIQKGLGYGRDFVRGYEYYVIDGPSYAYLKTNFKYSIVKERIYKIPFLKSEKFNTIPLSLHANIFIDMGRVKSHDYNNQTNYLDDDFLMGYGFGIDLVTYYDRLARFEYTINKLGESGFYIHFIAPI